MMRTALFSSLTLTWAALMIASPIKAALLPADLVAYYPFDGSGEDLSGNADVSIVDTSTAASSFTGVGKFAQAFDTDTDGGTFVSVGGKSDIARDLADNAGPKLIGDDSYTLTGWFKFNAIGGQEETQNNFFIDTSDLDSLAGGYSVRMTAGLINPNSGVNQSEDLIFLSGGTGATITLDAAGSAAQLWAANLWYFFAARLTSEAAGGLDVYLVPETGTFATKMAANGDGLAPTQGTALTIGAQAATAPWTG